MAICGNCGPTETRTRAFQGHAFNSKSTVTREITQCVRCGEVVCKYTPTEEEIARAAAAIKAANLAKLAAQTTVQCGERLAKHRLRKSRRKGSTVKGTGE